MTMNPLRLGLRLLGILWLALLTWLAYLGWRLRSIGNSDRPLRGKVRDVMTSDVRSVPVTTPLARVVQVMAETGHHHVPVVDATGKLAGMVTQSDVVAALFHVNQAELARSA